MSSFADVLVLDHESGELWASCYGREPRLVAEGVEALRIENAAVKALKAYGDVTRAELKLADWVRVEGRGGERVAVVGGERPDK